MSIRDELKTQGLFDMLDIYHEAIKNKEDPYTKISEIFEVSRDEAKAKFMGFNYGVTPTRFEEIKKIHPKTKR